MHEQNGVPNSDPRHCTDNLPSLTIGIDSSAPSPEPKHLLKLRLDSLFSRTVYYGLHHHHQCESFTIVKANDGPFIDSSFDPSHDPINYPSITYPSFVPSGDPSLSRGSNLHIFAFNSELNLHSDDVSRVDSSTIPNSGPRTFLVVCSIELLQVSTQVMI